MFKSLLSSNLNSDSVAYLINELHWALKDLSVDSTFSLEEFGFLIKKTKYEETEKKIYSKI